MNPVKRHRVVRLAVPSAGEADRYSSPAIESAENEGWPPPSSGAWFVRIFAPAAAHRVLLNERSWDGESVPC
jgi:hypothetical protein